MPIKGKNKFNFLELEFKDIKKVENLVEDIFNKKENGALIKGALNSDEISEILKLSKNLNEKEYKVTGSGFTFPNPFANVQDEDSRKEYIQSKKLMSMKTEESFGIDLNKKILSIIKLFSGKFNPTEPKFKDIPGSCASASQIRCFKENMGGLTIHTGNYFQDMFGFFYSSLDENIGKHEQLSYFFMIQKPTKGGELIVYDITWNEAQKKTDFQDNEFLILNSGEKIFVKDLEKTIISPDPGDLFIFHGGEIWHQVSEVENINRITLGGFMAKSKISNDLFLWA
jgi:hypothetical protein